MTIRAFAAVNGNVHHSKRRGLHRLQQIKPTAAHSCHQEAARTPQPLAMNTLAQRERDPWSQPNPARKKRNYLPPPSGPGPPRAVACQPGLVQRGSPAAPGASAGSVVPRGPAAPARVTRCGRAIAPASVFATAFGQPAYAVCLRQRAQPAAYAHARPVATQPFGRARPPRHALAAAPAPCALGHPRLRCPGLPRRHVSSLGSRRGHTRGPRPLRSPPDTACPGLIPSPVEASRQRQSPTAPLSAAAAPAPVRKASGPPSSPYALVSNRQWRRARLGAIMRA